MKHWLVIVMVSSLFLGVAAAAQDFPGELTAEIKNANGDIVGVASFGTVTAEMANDMAVPADTLEGAVVIWVQAQGLTPGFHGLHIHSVGTCDAAGERAFASAGGHLSAEHEAHGQHRGDLPSLLATDGGVAVLIVTTDGFTLEDLMDEDGSAIIIHAAADNFGNIPADRYDPDADETTLNTGDAGGRVGCGVIMAS